MIKLAYISGTRADFGLMKNVLLYIDEDPMFELTVIATGMHFMESHGNTIEEIRQSSLSVVEVPVTFKSDSSSDILYFASQFTHSLTEVLQKLKPLGLVLLGDRIEMLVGATAGLYLGLINIHLHGGDISGTVDELTRHAITKLSHIHLTASQKSMERVIRMGENPNNVFFVGAPGLTGIRTLAMDKVQLLNLGYLKHGVKNILFLMHPDASYSISPQRQIEITLNALTQIHAFVLILSSNSDPGSHSFLNVINSKLSEKNIFVKHLARDAFLGMMLHCDVMVGNSSAGIIEAGAFGTPVVNIGLRQKNRECGPNVFHVPYDENKIISSIQYLMSISQEEREKFSLLHPYGTENNSIKILNSIKNSIATPNIKNKQISY